MFRVGHDAPGAAKFDLLDERPVGPQQHDHRSDPVERGNGDEHAGAGIHQDTDGFTLAHADRQQARDHGVDTRLESGVSVGAVLPQEPDRTGVSFGAFVEEAAERHPRLGPHQFQAQQPRQISGGARSECPRRVERRRAQAPAGLQSLTHR